MQLVRRAVGTFDLGVAEEIAVLREVVEGPWGLVGVGAILVVLVEDVGEAC